MLHTEEVFGCVAEAVDGEGREGDGLFGLVGRGLAGQGLEVFAYAVKAFEDGSQGGILLFGLFRRSRGVDGVEHLLDAVEHGLHLGLLLFVELGLLLGIEVVLKRGLVLFLIFGHNGLELFLREGRSCFHLLLEVQQLEDGH